MQTRRSAARRVPGARGAAGQQPPQDGDGAEQPGPAAGDRARGRVRGPQSALTSFLEEHGITRRIAAHRAAVAVPAAETEAAAEAEPEPNAAQTDEGEDASATDVQMADEQQVAATAAPAGSSRTRLRVTKKRTRGDGDGSDDSDTGAGASGSRVPRRDAPDADEAGRTGHVRFCTHCKSRFLRVTMPQRDVYGGDDESEAENEGAAVPRPILCPTCAVQAATNALRTGPAAGATKRRKRTRNIDDGQTGESGRGRGTTSLVDLCVRLVGAHVNDIESLGDIGDTNRDRVARVISRLRELNSKTLWLFLAPERTHLQLYDCTRVDLGGLKAIAAMCPNLESLRLEYVGRMTDQVVEGYAARLRALTVLRLHGPYLVHDAAFASMLQQIGGGLTILELAHAAQFGQQACRAVAEHCTSLEELRLQYCQSVDDACLLLLAGRPNVTTTSADARLDPAAGHGHSGHDHEDEDDDGMEDVETARRGKRAATRAAAETAVAARPTNTQTSLHKLEVLELRHIAVLSDLPVISLVTVVGSGLVELAITEQPDLTDAVLTDAIAMSCRPSRLKELDVGGCVEFTDDGVVQLFDKWTALAAGAGGGGLSVLILDGCTSLADASLVAALAHSAPTLTMLGLKSLDLLTEDDGVARISTSQCRRLENLNVSWVRAASDLSLKKVVDTCPALSRIEVWGCNRVTPFAPRRDGLRYVGRECDTL